MTERKRPDNNGHKRYTPPPCPVARCESQDTYVYSTQWPIRYIKCGSCGKLFSHADSSR